MTGQPIKITEKHLEKYVFDNLEEFIGEYDQKKKQRPPYPPFVDDLETSYGVGGTPENAAFYRKQLRVDILANRGDKLFIIEIKKANKNGSASGLRDGIAQLLEYNMLACQSDKYDPLKIEMFLISDQMPESTKRIVDFYHLPITLVKLNCDALKGKSDDAN